MARVSAECAVAYAMIGGWRSQTDIITAVAVAMQESDLNTDAANSCCVGLWQINLKAHNTTSDKMKNPVANAQMAYKVWSAAGGKWCATGSPSAHTCNPWQAYGASQPGRSWKQAMQLAANAYMSVIAKGIASDVLSGASSSDPTKILADKGLNCIGTDVLGGGGLPSVPNPLDAAGAFVSAFNRMGSWITNPDNLMRIFKVMAGGAIILVGGAALMDREITSVATKVLPVGRVAKAVTK